MSQTGDDPIFSYGNGAMGQKQQLNVRRPDIGSQATRNSMPVDFLCLHLEA